MVELVAAGGVVAFAIGFSSVAVPPNRVVADVAGGTDSILMFVKGICGLNWIGDDVFAFPAVVAGSWATSVFWTGAGLSVGDEATGFSTGVGSAN